jgi:hypothetical protein
MSRRSLELSGTSRRSKIGLGFASLAVVGFSAVYLVGPTIPAAYSAVLTVKPGAGLVGETVIYGSFSSTSLPVKSAVVTVRTSGTTVRASTPKFRLLPREQVIHVTSGHAYRVAIAPGNESVSVVITSGGHVLKATTKFLGRTGHAYKVSGRMQKNSKSFVFIPFTSY